jgi:hypothetical protein
LSEHLQNLEKHNNTTLSEHLQNLEKHNNTTLSEHLQNLIEKHNKVIVYQLLAHGRWFSPSTPASSTSKTGRHDIAEMLLKVALKHQKSNQITNT